ncbi:MAG: NAD(P)/FAD-dependent oxidoreductase [Acidimicrobiales bacterium]
MPEPERVGRRSLRVGVIGAGMAGILAVIKLREAGITDIVCFEKADRVGGTWRENTYPGIACDVPSHVYSYSFAPNPDFSRMFSPGDEIHAYLEKVAIEHGVVPHLRLGDEVVSAVYDGGTWRLETAQGHRANFDVVIAATGVLHHPRLPEIDGLDDFEGAMFHSARWDHDVPLDGRRVGLIGTGSTAVQITSALVDRVQQLSLFQRTPQWIMPMDNKPFTDDQRATFQNEPHRLEELRGFLESAFAENFADAVVDAKSERLEQIEETCRANLYRHVTDTELRRRLEPDYRAACKRLVVSADFYDAIQKPNAELVTAAISRIERRGIRTDGGRLHELDVIVLATGFEVDRFMRPTVITGLDGRTLEEAWADGPTAYLSVSIPEFPNLFMLNGPNGPVGNFSLIQVAELQMDYILQLVHRLQAGLSTEIHATEPAMREHEARRIEAAQATVWVTGCNSWYLDVRGVPAAWPWPFRRFREVMAVPDLGAYHH